MIDILARTHVNWLECHILAQNFQMEGQHFSEHDKAFYKDGYRLGTYAKSEESEAKLFEAISAMYKGIDELIDSLLEMAKKQGIQVDCKKGCAWCCKQAVFANSYEIHYLGRYIQKNFAESEKKAIIERAKFKNDKTEALGETEVLNFKADCPLLKNGVCSAYEARPMACRIYLSQKVNTCLDFYKNPEDENNYPALLEFPLRAGRMMNEGFTAALKEDGTMTAEFRLEEGLLTFLQ